MNIELKSKIIQGIDRNYKLSLHSNEKEQKFLSINIQKGKLSKEIIIIENDFSEFVKVINEMTEYKTYDVKEIREKHRQAYKTWSEEDENLLEQLYCEKKSVIEIAEILNREKGAIQSRIQKLELKDKYR